MTNTKSALKISSGVLLVITFIAFPITFYVGESLLPPELLAFNAQEMGSDLTISDMVALPWMLLFVICLFGLLLGKAWAELPFLFLMVFSIGLAAASNTVVLDPISSALDDFASILAGLVCGLILMKKGYISMAQEVGEPES